MIKEEKTLFRAGDETGANGEYNLHDKIEYKSMVTDDYKVNLVLPGDLITSQKGFINGHGTYEDNGSIYASVIGSVEKTNKLIIVNPIKSKFVGEVGDVVVGRIIKIENKKWRVEVNAYNHATLHLNSINIPSGIQRRKNEDDELNMRMYFTENDIISAEVHSIKAAKGTLTLHTRNQNYGRLKNGILVKVNSKLIKSMKSHFLTLKCGVSLIMGKNGNIWVYYRDEVAMKPEDNKEIPAKTGVTSEERLKMARVKNAIDLLDRQFVDISVDNINWLFDESMRMGLEARDMISSTRKEPLLKKFKEFLDERIENDHNKHFVSVLTTTS